MSRFLVEHCGHPTALFPWLPYIDGTPLLAPNSKAWQLKREAVAACEMVISGELKTHQRGGWTICGERGQNVETWELIWKKCPRKAVAK